MFIAPSSQEMEPPGKSGRFIIGNVHLDGQSLGALIEILPGPVDLEIDIMPGSDPNSVNPKSKGVIPVAILGSVDFDATQVDFSTVVFGPDSATEVHGRGHIGDVNSDGYADMVLHFKTQQTGISCGDREATLIGESFGGQQFSGTDSIETVGCP